MTAKISARYDPGLIEEESLAQAFVGKCPAGCSLEVAFEGHCFSIIRRSTLLDRTPCDRYGFSSAGEVAEWLKAAVC